MARNCHKSVYHAVFLNELRPVYIYPEFDETMELNMAVSPEKIERLLEEHKEVQAVVLTSPTYGCCRILRGFLKLYIRKKFR